MTRQESKYLKLANDLFSGYAHVGWNEHMLRLEVVPFDKMSGYFLTREGMDKYDTDEIVMTMFQYWDKLEERREAKHRA
mgnify:FL=1